MDKPISDLHLVILCGGRGVRLRPLTDRVPKALVPVHGRPIIDHVLDFFVAKGIGKATLCIGYKGDQIRQYFSEKRRDCNIQFSDAGENASMLQRLKLAADLIGTRFFVAYCDTFLDLDPTPVIAHHEKRDALITLISAKIQSPFGIVSIADGVVTSFKEKPVFDYFIGSFIVEPAAFEQATEAMLSMPEGNGLVALFDTFVRSQKLAAYQHEGLKITFNTESERDIAEQELLKFYTYRETS